MIPVAPVPEPAEFHSRARVPGNAWVLANPGAARPRDLWSAFRGPLADGFGHRCGYTAMYEPVGTVDHFASYHAEPRLAYEWSNYRFASQWINSSKRAREVLDPYLVGEGWFEVLLPSLQLVATDKVPPEHRAAVERTLAILPIAHDERVVRQRRGWYQMYLEGKLSLAGLRSVAPLVAAAEEKRQRLLSEGSPDPSNST